MYFRKRSTDGWVDVLRALCIVLITGENGSGFFDQTAPRTTGFLIRPMMISLEKSGLERGHDVLDG